MKKLYFTVYVFSPFPAGGNPDSKVISRHSYHTRMKQAINRYEGSLCVGWKAYEGEKKGDNVDNYLRSL